MGFSKLLRLAAVSATLITQGTLTAQTPGLSQTVAWNNAAVTFIAQTLDVTDTASAAGSLLARWRVGGVDKFVVSKAGAVTAGAASFTTGEFSDAVTLSKASQVDLFLWQTGANAIKMQHYAATVTNAGLYDATASRNVITYNSTAATYTISVAAIAGSTLKSTGDLTVGASTFVVTAATGAVAMGSNASITAASGATPYFQLVQTGVVTWTFENNATSGLFAIREAGVANRITVEKTTGLVTCGAALAITGALTGVTTATISGGGKNLGLVSAASGTEGTSNYIDWFRANGSTVRSRVGFIADDSADFYIATLQAADRLLLASGNGVTALTLATDQAATFASTVDATGYKVSTKAFVFGANDSAGAGFRTVVLTNA